MPPCLETPDGGGGGNGANVESLCTLVARPDERREQIADAITHPSCLPRWVGLSGVELGRRWVEWSWAWTQ